MLQLRARSRAFSLLKKRLRITSIRAMSQQQTTPSKPANPVSADSSSGVAVKKATPSKWQRVVAAAVDQAQLDKALKIVQQLQQLYPNPPIPLDHSNTFQLLVAVMLSAQTTDLKVNQVTPQLFAAAPDAAAMAAMEVSAIQQIIQPIGLAPTKAKNVSNMSKLLLERHEGSVPSTFEELEALPGVGHKTASVVMVQAFGHPAFPVDTHIHRLATRWGLSTGKSVEQTEADLKALLPQDTWRDAALQVIYFGREHCPAQRHNYTECPICSWAAVTTSNGACGTAAAPNSKRAGGNVKQSAVAKRKPAQEAAAAAVALVASEERQGAVTILAAGHVLVSDKARANRRRRQ